MSLKQRLQRQLGTTRGMTERLLADFQKPEEWLHQVHSNCNHALWFVGHMATTDNFFISLVAPDRVKAMPEFQPKFGMGSQPTADAGNYPPPADVLAVMRERRETLLDVLDKMSEDDLAQKTAPGAPAFVPDFGSVFEAAIWHEGLHAGQLTVVRRALGYPSVMSAG